MRFRLRTLMMVLALGPPLIWAAYAIYDELRLVRIEDKDLLRHYIETVGPPEYPDPSP